MKYKVTAYSLDSVLATVKGELKFVHRWKKINSWTAENKSIALVYVRTWSNYKQPFFKATIQSMKGGK